MSAIRKKLNSRRGASFVIAMLFFLICTMIASVLITAAVSNAGRTEKQRDEAQAYLAASSAARLLRDDLAGLSTFAASRVGTVYTCRYSAHQNSITQWDAVGECTGSALADYVTQAAVYICRGNSYWEKSFKVTADAAALAEVPVTVVMGMDSNYNMKFELSAETADGARYAITLSVAGSAVSDSSTNDDDYCTHHEQSSTPVLVGGEWVYPVVDVNYSIYTTTYTNTVTWSPGTMAKGE